MNLVKLTAAYLRARALNTGLNVLLLGVGVAVVTVLLLVGNQIEDRLTRDARDISLVVGAKGSPMQLVLAAVFHVDVPPGNIRLADAQALAKNPLVKRTIPLALGDNFRGYRIAGTTPALGELYEARLAAGRLWEKPMEAVLGAEVAAATRLAIGGKFTGTHGLGEGGEEHDAVPYVVTGVLAPTGTVVDRLVLTSVESVWLVHMHLGEDEQPEEAIAALTDDEKEITAMLVQYASPLAAMSLPLLINTQTPMQAASPATESARLFSMLGVGLDVLRGFAAVLMIAAGLSIFIALFNAMKERRYDLAVMRMLGATPGKLMRLILFEGLLLALIGALIGLVLGHLVTEIIGWWLAANRQPAVTGRQVLPEELVILAAALAVGLVAALIPAVRAYRRDVAMTLAGA
jgi:putative ABC transport system permease protein